MTVKEAKIYIHSKLSALYPENEIQSFTKLIFSDIFSMDSLQFILNKDQQVSTAEEKKLNEIIARLQNFEPLQYIIGYTEFYGLNFRVNKEVLIPRPETEELVDLIVNENSGKRGLKIMDVGTGSGCIAVALAKHFPEASISALDISESALDTAKSNASDNNVQITFIQGNILLKNPQLKSRDFDLIVSNPPYVRSSEKQNMEQNVTDWEPELALFVEDDDPFAFYEAIVEFAKEHLKKNGKLYFEINEAFGAEIKQMLLHSSFHNVKIMKDMNGKDRIARGDIE